MSNDGQASKPRVETSETGVLGQLRKKSRKQLESALYYAGGGWRSAGLIANELSQLCEIGDGFADAGEWANAQAVYATITGEAIKRYEELEDEWQIAAIID